MVLRVTGTADLPATPSPVASPGFEYAGATIDQAIDPMSVPKDALSDALEKKIDADPDSEYTVPAEDDLAWHVYRSFERAKDNKDNAGISTRIERALRSRRGEYEADEIELLDGIDVWFPLTDRQCRVAIAFLRNTLTSSDQRLWDIEATPEPNLPDRVKRMVVDKVGNEVRQSLSLGIVPSPEELTEYMTHLKSVVRDAARDVTSQAMDGMRVVIDDQLVEANWTRVFDTFVDHLCTFPTAVVRGPVITRKPKLEWSKNEKVRVSTAEAVSLCNPHPRDIYPSSDSTTPHDGTFLIERMDISRAELREARQLPGFLEDRIGHVLELYKDSPRDWLNSVEDEHGADDNEDRVSEWGDEETIDVLLYNGKVPGELLVEAGLDKTKITELLDYEAEVWVIGRYVIRAVLNPHPLGKRPYGATSWSKRTGTFWGESPVDIARPFQRIANANIRAMIRNMGYSSAPVFEVNVDRLAEGQAIPNEVAPGVTIHTQNDLAAAGGQKGRVIDPIRIDNHSQSYMGTLLQIVEQAELATGLPRYLLGSSAAGGAARTLGGLASLQNNAAIGLKSVVTNIDMDVVEPIVSSLYVYNLQTHPDKTIKSDAQIVAKGSNTVLQRELNKNRILEAIQVLMPFVQSKMVPPQAIGSLLREVMALLGLPKSLIPDPETQSELTEFVNKMGSAPGIGGVASPDGGGARPVGAAPPNPVVGLDGRSTVEGGDPFQGG